jgi:hypothetical protein
MAQLSMIGMLDGISHRFDSTQLHLTSHVSLQPKVRAYAFYRNRDQGYVAEVAVDRKLEAFHAKAP